PWAERQNADDYVNREMLDGVAAGTDDDAAGAGTGNTATATLSNKRLMNRLKAFIRTDAGIRHLGDEAFTAGLAAQKHLLRGLFTADGVINNNSIELRSPNRALLEDVQLLLLGFGVQSAIVDADAAANLVFTQRGFANS